MAEEAASKGLEVPRSEAESAAQAVMEAAQALGNEAGGLEALLDVDLTVSVELGRTRMKIQDILNLGSGSVIELSRLASEPVDLLVNETPFAQGEVVVVEDSFAIRITKVFDRSSALARRGS